MLFWLTVLRALLISVSMLSYTALAWAVSPVCITLLGGIGFGVAGWHDVPGGVLIRTGRALFRYDPLTGGFYKVGDAEADTVFSWHDVPGGVLILTGRSLLRYEFASGGLGKPGGTDTGAVFDWHDVPG